MGSPRLLTRMGELTASPVRVAVRANVVWLDTLRGAGVLLSVGALIWSFSTGEQQLFWVVLLGTAALNMIAWAALRHLGRPLRLAPGGGYLGATESTLFFAPANVWTGRPRGPVQAWPRADVVLFSSAPVGARRLLKVGFRGAGQVTRLEILGRNKDAVATMLFTRR